jgi:hypothetical protein
VTRLPPRPMRLDTAAPSGCPANWDARLRHRRICRRPACAPMPESPCLPDNARQPTRVSRPQTLSRQDTRSLRTPSALMFPNVEGVPSKFCAVIFQQFRWKTTNRRGRRSAAPSTSGKLPATNNNRSHSPRSLYTLYTLYTLYSLYTLSTRVARQPEVFGRFPCRRHRKSPG